MFKNAKKLLAVLLCVLMLSSTAALVASAETEVYPVIYLKGYGAPIYTDKTNASSEEIYPTGADVEAIFKENLTPILGELATAYATGDYSSYCDALYNSIAPIYDKLRLNPDGTVKDNSGRPSQIISASTNYFDCKEIYLYYDWRLSPITLAETLSDFIDKVCDKYKTDKVNLLGRCYGANVVSSYLTLHAEHAAENVHKVVLYTPSVEGISLIGSVFSGDIQVNPDNIDVYAKELMEYEVMMEDGMMKDFVHVMLSVMEQATILEFGADTLQDIIDNVREDLFPRLIRDTYGSFPAFWAMVPDKYFDAAVELVYNTDELRAEYEGTISLIKEYNEKIQKPAQENLKAQSKVHDIYVVAKYNLPSAPFFGDSNPTGDAVADTVYMSFGATAADYGTRLGEEYIASMSEQAKAYLSADEKIDASTCALPDKTWFIKNNYHDHFVPSVDKLINEMLMTEGMTVFTNESYPQFLDYDAETDTITPVNSTDKDLAKPGSKQEKFEMLYNFVMFVIKALVQLISRFA